MTTTSIDPAGGRAPTADRSLLINRATRRRLESSGGAIRPDAQLDLLSARRLAFCLGQNGTALYLLALLNAALRGMAAQYLDRQQLRPGWQTLVTSSGRQRLPELAATYTSFAAEYQPAWLDPAALRPGGRGPAVRAGRTRLLVDLCLWDTQQDNPASAPFQPLSDTADARLQARWRRLMALLTQQLRAPAGDSVWQQDLRQLLRAPLQAAPNDLAGQVAYVLKHWAAWLPAELQRELAVARAVVAEEARPHLAGPGPGEFAAGPGSADESFPAAFTRDRDWMASSVLLAKSIHVWLDQLNRRYPEPIERLDQIPDPELDRLATWGFNALWLIGIWERSSASRTIKRLCGNPEAEASAYALMSYRVAADLGGEAALDDLERRCTARGIRLACDVVPNHTGIDSELLRQHPDWFIQAEIPPYPGYRFDGPDLCDDPQLSIRIEAGYWDHSDAAVVFEHLDHGSGRRRYIYHGNDGTHMPWNDTAQLNFLLPEVRQAMSDLIVAIARRFRLIRFDAAMTLARKHFRRLWFPPPGGSAGVPSRSAAWLGDADFDRAFPVEFWREVVDRINRELPDTLLIAEAFWLMESYFVRTLGMHRVYNSAFMNLLKREENAKFRHILKETLAFNPEILKRYVNFMNNPDEATAVAQFGKGDKYFAVAVLLATLPGLPMFGHGQLEGFEEKYGMEYRRAYWGEQPDSGFIAHHESQICPLLRQRHRFAEVRDFAMYDFVTAFGVDEHVYAYSNGAPGEQTLIIVNNSPQTTRGRIHQATPMAHPDREGEAAPAGSLAERLALGTTGDGFCRFRDHRDGRQALRPLSSLQQGLEVELGPYGYHVFHDFRIAGVAADGWDELYRQIGDRAVADLDREHLRLRHGTLWSRWQQLFAPARLQLLSSPLLATPLLEPARQVLTELTSDLNAVAAELCTATQTPMPKPVSDRQLRDDLCRFGTRLGALPAAAGLWTELRELWCGTPEIAGLAWPLLSWRLCEQLRRQLPADSGMRGCWADYNRFGLEQAWQELAGGPERQRDLGLVALLLDSAARTPLAEGTLAGFTALVQDPAHQALFGINRHAGQTWFNREQMLAAVAALALQAVWLDPAHSSQSLADIAARCRQRLAAVEASGYRLDKFLALG